MRLLILCLFISSFSFGQAKSKEIDEINKQIESIELTKNVLTDKLETLKLAWIQKEINTIGVPTSSSIEEVLAHSAYQFSYNEEHEQANWVMHLILPDIISGTASRTNDFRIDSLVKTGSAVEQDYFLKTLKSDSSYSYDGFGYDRGHLAPSADFKWSKQALSESYYYSNMSPQLGDFNRFKWAELENWMRAYVTAYDVSLVIITAPILSDSLLKIERSVNGISIPKLYVKVALDTKNNRAIGFVMPNEKISLPIEFFATSVDSVEKLLGYDLFSGLDDAIENDIEAKADYQFWMPESQNGDVKAIVNKRLPKKSFSTYGVKVLVDDRKKHTVCGKVVSTTKHEKGHVFLNLDKKFPNQIFSVSIFSSSISNFAYEPELYLIDKEVCFTAEVGDYQGTPNMVLDNGKQVKLLNEF
jgi:endonuclease G